MRFSTVLMCYSKLPKRYSNFPDKYVKKQTEFIQWETPRRVNYNPTKIRWTRYPYYDRYRSWTQAFQAMNKPGEQKPRIWVEPMERFYVFNGDRVQVLRGKDKGKQGVVKYVVEERNWVFVEGLNAVRTIRQMAEDSKYVTIVEQPLLVPRDVALVDPSDKQPTTIKWKYTETGELVRVSDRTGYIIMIPLEAFKTYDYLTPEQYIESPKDSNLEETTKVTFEPVLKTFEMDIADQQGIKEDRIPHKTYWY
ncbi:probable 39S ribosomal protein L24, mitochondrial [Tetranychus urticae]|uniref:Large ribosomal subunit protein uL24m n=1 Tax=Tetranychus urticae TaxID=32264 RepID=T1KCB8_TETUR|nr:probable 39S ribosomal protein L24, mitochondrial [Tetranychus urticae]